MMRRPYVLLLLSVLSCCALRFGLIAYGSPHMFHPYFDEPVSGTLTYDLLQGTMRAPLIAYQYEHRSGDMMIEAVLMYPLAALFGHSMLTIKLCALLCSLVCMLGWVYFINRYCGVTAALLFAVLFALPPPMFARLSLVGTFSSHHMISLILILQLICLFRMLEKGAARVSVLLWFACGLCAGLGTYAFYSYLIFNAFCALFVLCCGRRIISVRGIGALAAGGLCGFAPWLWRSVSYSSGGGNFLMGILSNISIAPREFAQTFLHMVPYTLGYGYPTRQIGWWAIVFCGAVLCAACVLVREAVPGLGPARAPSFIKRPAVPAKLYGFIVLFPVFFLVCLTLSPMQVNPFEYWPSVGLFALFPPADVIRCRWVTVLYPFYFALAGIGLSVLLARRGARAAKVGGVLALAVVLAVNAVCTSGLFSRRDAGALRLYKGYNFDQFAARFLYNDYYMRDLRRAEKLVAGYPDESREDAWRSLGTIVFFSLQDRDDAGAGLLTYLDGVPQENRDAFIYGAMRAWNGAPEQQLLAWAGPLIRSIPAVFYKNWGAQYLAYKYYGCLVNESQLLARCAPSELFFFNDFFNRFTNDRWQDYRRYFPGSTDDPSPAEVEAMLMRDVRAVPDEYRGLAVSGIGRLVGAEMLFDCLHAPDYPLDSSIGRRFDAGLRRDFYRGVGSGFAETLCRYWRRLMPPDSVSCDMYARGLEIEWQRCMDLMNKMPADLHPLLREGFLAELEGRALNESIRAFIARKLSMR